MKHVNTSPELQEKSDEVMDMLQKDETPEVHPKSAQIRDDMVLTDEKIIDGIVTVLKEIYDPEIPVNIYDLGLIYGVEVIEGVAKVDMTLTTPGCPVAQTFPGMVENSIKGVDGVVDATVELVWDPPWTQDNLSEEARLQLGLI